MRKNIQYRINLDAHQKARFAEIVGCSRWVYNHYLHEQMQRTQRGELMLPYRACLKDLEMQLHQYTWLQSADPYALQFSLRHLIKEYQVYVKKGYPQNQTDFPAFQKKKAYPKTYSTHICTRDFNVSKGELELPMLGTVKLDIKQAPIGEICDVTLTETKENEFFIAFNCDIVHAKKVYLHFSQQMVFGEMSAHIQRTTARLQKMQKKLLKKCAESQNYLKEERKIKKLERHIQNQKWDSLYKQSKKWVQKNDVIIVENRTAESKHKLVSDTDWAEFLRLLKQQSREHQKKLVILKNSLSH